MSIYKVIFETGKQDLEEAFSKLEMVLRKDFEIKKGKICKVKYLEQATEIRNFSKKQNPKVN